MVGASVIVDIAYHSIFHGHQGNVNTFFALGLLVFVNFSAISAARGNYRPNQLIALFRQCKEVTLAWLGVCLILLSAAFSLKISETFSRGATISFFLLGGTLVIAWRIFLGRFLKRAMEDGAFAEQKIILIAEETQLRSSEVLPELARCGYRPIQTVQIKQDEVQTTGISRSLQQAIEGVLETSRHFPVKDVFLLVGWEQTRFIDEILLALRILPLRVHLLPDENVSRFLVKPGLEIGHARTVELKRAPLTIGERALKRSIDILGAVASLVTLAPLLLLTALLIKLDSEGPVLFTQKRNGFNGRDFRIFKFRTMCVLEDGPEVQQVKRDDPRVTRVGRLLRRTSIDELPQLLNVLVGEMSLCGPRPHAAAHNSEYERLISNYAFRYHVKPGITGWAQVNGYRGETENVSLMAERVEHDLWYIDHWSVWLDLKILLQTCIIVLKQKKAY